MATNPNFATVVVPLDVKQKIREAAFYRKTSQCKLAAKAIIAYLEATEEDNNNKGEKHE